MTLDKHRTFIAVRIQASKPILNALQEFKDELSNEAVKWVRTDLMHLTLAFLGSTPSRMIPPIVEILNHTAGSFVPFSIQVRGAGVFPKETKPRVLWVGIEDPPENLKKIQAHLSQQIAELGFSLEERAFNPHLTLGRIKYLRNLEMLKKLLEKYRNADFHEEYISELIFYESITRPEGPEYLPLARCVLGRK